MAEVALRGRGIQHTMKEEISVGTGGGNRGKNKANFPRIPERVKAQYQTS